MRGRKGKAGAWVLWGAILIAYLYPLYLFPIHNPNERVRIYMTAAMVEHNTFAIGYREKKGRGGNRFRDSGSVTDKWGYVNDKALACEDPDAKPPDCAGALYSAKAPGTSYLGYPFYAAGAFVADTLGRSFTMYGAIIYLRLFVVIIPSLFMLVLIRRFAAERGLDEVAADLITAGVALGSMVFTYSHMFAGHQISAYLLFFGFYAAYVSATRPSWIWPALSGVAAGMGVCVEYPMLLVFMAVFLFQWKMRPRLSTWLLFGAGALGPALSAAWYHWAAFGHPLKTPYSTLENPQFVKDIAPGFMGLRAPSLENLFGAFVSPFEGLFYFAPWMALAFLLPFSYFVRDLRTDDKTSRAVVFCALGSVALLCLFISCHSLWRGGWTLGPRYIVPVVPFAALLLIQSAVGPVKRHPIPYRVLLAVLVLVSIVVTGGSSLVSQGFHTAFYNPLAEVTFPLLKLGYITASLGSALGLGVVAAAVPLALAAIALFGYLTWRSAGRSNTAWPVRIFLFSLIILLTVASVRALTIPAEPVNTRKVKALRFTKENFYPFPVQNPDLERKQFAKDAAAVMPDHTGIQALSLYDLACRGKCKQSLFGFKKWKSAWDRARGHSAYSAMLPLVAPFPSVATPIPLLLRPDHRLNRRQVERLEKKAEDSAD